LNQVGRVTNQLERTYTNNQEFRLPDSTKEVDRHLLVRPKIDQKKNPEMECSQNTLKSLEIATAKSGEN
jgi:hypothetical protein